MVIEGPPVPFEPRTLKFLPAVDSLRLTDSNPDANLPYFELASSSKRLSLGNVMSTPLYSASIDNRLNLRLGVLDGDIAMLTLHADTAEHIL